MEEVGITRSFFQFYWKIKKIQFAAPFNHSIPFWDSLALKPAAVWPDWPKLHHFDKILKYLVLLEGIFSLWQNVKLFWKFQSGNT